MVVSKCLENSCDKNSTAQLPSRSVRSTDALTTSHYLRTFQKTLGSNPALEKRHMRTRPPGRPRSRAAKPASARRGPTPSHQPRTPRAARGRRLLTAPGGSGSRAPAAGRRGRDPRPAGPSGRPWARPSSSRRRPRVAAPPRPRSLFILDAEAGDNPSPVLDGGERDRKGSPWLPRLRGRVPN